MTKKGGKVFKHLKDKSQKTNKQTDRKTRTKPRSATHKNKPRFSIFSEEGLATYSTQV